ncbi:hypothetical protein BKA70DRAFT_1246871, partial [Coprinopsis sp. MPI-PUGE-AT-0042]
MAPGATLGPRRTIKSPTGRYIIMPNAMGTRRRVQIQEYPLRGLYEGGADRAFIEGTQMYGSGYPDQPSRGIKYKDFPFTFWPIIWEHTDNFPEFSFIKPGASNLALTTYVRPGGILVTCTIDAPKDSDSPQSVPATYHVISDKATIELLASRIERRCSSGLRRPLDCRFYHDARVPRPEQVVQYYRASSAALAVVGYNNTAMWEKEGTPDIPVPGNYSKLECLKSVMSQELALVTGPVEELPVSSGMNEASQTNLLLVTIVVLLSI